MSNIYIKKNILTSKELSDDAIGTYIALRCIYTLEKPIQYVSINRLCFELYGNSKFTRYTKEKISHGLDQLISTGIISKLETISKTEFILDLSNLFINSDKGTTDYFVIITDEEIKTIFNHNSRCDKFAMLKFFTLLIGSISYSTTIKDARKTYGDTNNFVGFMPQSYLSEIANISESTTNIYLSILEELHLIYVYRHSDLKWNSETKQISSFVNKYGRFKDKEMITYFAENYESFSNIETIKKMQKKKDVNYRRSLMQKYRCLCNGHQYDTKTIEEIREYIHLRNEITQDKIKQAETDTKRDFYATLLYDETIFNKITNTKKSA